MTATLETDANDDIAVGLVSAELGSFFTRKVRSARAHHPQFSALWELTAERMRGGKFVRPLVFLRTVETLSSNAESTAGRTLSPSLVQIAAAVELLHFSFLLHDDVIDGDMVRRGRPNLIGTILEQHAESPSGDDVRALHWARSCAILMGDLLLAEVHQIFARAELEGHQRTRLLELLSQAITDSVVGELIDVGLSDGVISPELSTILEMCRLKTATYSFEFPLRLAATLTGASARVEESLARAGRHLGLAYQLHDDVLSIFGDPVQHGKDSFSDLREGKETVLIAYARMTSAWGAIEPHFGSPSLTEESGAAVRRVLSECGALSFVSSLIDDELRALDELLDHESAELPDAAQAALRALATELAARTS